MKRFLAAVAGVALLSAGAAVQAQTLQPAISGPGISDCLTSIFVQLRKESRTQWREKLATCDAFIATNANSLTPDEYYSVLVERAKLDYLNRNYEQMAADIAKAKGLTTVEGDAAETRLRKDTVAALDIFYAHLDDKTDTVLKRAHALSDVAGTYSFPHQLYMNLAFTAGAYDEALEALRRQLRLQPNMAGFVNMAQMLVLQEKPALALRTLESELDTASPSVDLAPVLMAYEQAEAAAGDYNRAGKVLQLLQADKPEAERKQVQAQVFASKPSLAHRSFNLRLNYHFAKKVTVETAINLMERGDNAGAVAALGDTSLFCRDLRCMRLQAVVAEAHGDQREADRLKQKIAHSVASLARPQLGTWEADFILSLPGQPLERFTLGKNYSPDAVSTFKDDAGVFRIVWKDKTATGATRTKLALIDAAKAEMKKKEFTAFVIRNVKLGYSYSTHGKGPKEFRATTGTIYVLPVSSGAFDSLEQVPWRHISVN